MRGPRTLRETPADPESRVYYLLLSEGGRLLCRRQSSSFGWEVSVGSRLRLQIFCRRKPWVIVLHSLVRANALSVLQTHLDQRKASTFIRTYPRKGFATPNGLGHWQQHGPAHVNNAHSLRTSLPPHSCLLCFSPVYSSTSHSVNVSCLHIYHLCQHYSNYWQNNTLVDYKTQLMGHS